MRAFLIVASLFLAPLLTGGQPANPYLVKLYSSLSDATNDTARMDAYSKLGSYYSLENRDSAILYLEKAYSLASELNLKLNEASILNKLGIIQMQQEKFSRSLEFYLKAMHIAKDPTIEKTIWQLLPGQNPTSARMLEVSRSYDYIGLLNAYTGNWTDNIKNQMKNYREAEIYANASGDKAQIATVIFHMGIAYLNAGTLDSALMFLKKAESDFTALNDPQLGRSKLYLGETYLKMGNPDLAANTLLQAISILNKTNDNVHRGLVYQSLSRVYAELNKTDSALQFAKESFNIFEKRNDPAWKRDAANLLASLFDRLGRTDSSDFYLKMAKSLTDSLGVEERKNLLAFQDILIDEQKKLEQLEKEKIETREKMKTSLLLSGIAVFVVIALLLYRNNRARKKTNEMLQQRNEKIENTLHQLRSTQAQLIQSEKMASLGELTAGIAHEIQNPLNFVNNFSDLNKELIDELQEELKKGDVREASSIAENLKENEVKINLHGKRADGIVKSMLQHSRASSGQKEPTNVNQLVDEYVRLAYHGYRARRKEFNVRLDIQADPATGKVNMVSQDIGRVLLNLLNNAFQAVEEKAKSAGPDYQPTVTISTRSLNEESVNPIIRKSDNAQSANALMRKSVIVRVADNGTGIPEKVKEKIFQPFFTTKPTGQGTGLGLSLSYDIVTKGHGGELNMETTEGMGTTFTIRLPLQ